MLTKAAAMVHPTALEETAPSRSVGREEVRRALALVGEWVENHNYRGYEPFDGLSSWARPLALGNQFAERLLMQAIRQSPLNLRPLMGVRPQESTKGRGYMARGYLTLYRATQQHHFLEKAIACLKWLDRSRAPRFPHHAWSNHFDFVARGGSYTRHDPIIVWTSLIGQAYIDAFELTHDRWFLDIATSACDWILSLPREKTEHGTCLSYRADVQSSIHNSNMLGAALLARTARYCGNDTYVEVARSAMEYSCSRQRADGSWWYGEEDKYHWIDNFHTGYNLDSLYLYCQAVGDSGFHSHLDKGLAFYRDHFFEDSGRPRYYHVRTYPVDIQCAAQSIDTLSLLSQREPAALKLAERVALWTIRHMQDTDGYFYYRQYPLLKATTPMLHWGQATMFAALAHLYLLTGETAGR